MALPVDPDEFSWLCWPLAVGGMLIFYGIVGVALWGALKEWHDKRGDPPPLV